MRPTCLPCCVWPAALPPGLRGGGDAIPQARQVQQKPWLRETSPRGTIPSGWQVYRGTADFPLVVAYPPDWTADDSLLPEQRIVSFYGPNGREDDERIDIEIGQTQTGANIDVQRDAFFHLKSDCCEKKGIEYTEHRQIAEVAFAILSATCDSSNDLTVMQVASGLKNGDEWNILMRS